MTLRVMKRMLRDFPWLWAIGKEWDHKKVEIFVSSDKKDLHTIFHKTMSELTRSQKIFIQVTTIDGVEQLISVKGDKPPLFRLKINRLGYDQAILNAAPSGSHINYFVEVKTSRNSDAITIWIKRPPLCLTGKRCFRDWLTENSH